MKTDDGLGKEAQIEVGENGGKQSKLGYSFHLLDAPAIMELAHVVSVGAEKYARDNWRLIEAESHINHALTHLFAYQSGDTRDDHLEHAFCRIMMALAKKLRPDYYGHANPKKESQA